MESANIKRYIQLAIKVKELYTIDDCSANSAELDELLDEIDIVWHMLTQEEKEYIESPQVRENLL